MFITRNLKIRVIFFLVLGFLFGMSSLNAQVTIGSNEEPDPSAVLDIRSKDKGLLITRVNLSGKFDRTTIPNPAHGLLVFNLSYGNNGTPNDASDDVYEDTFYVFSSKSNSWELLVADDFLEQKLTQMGVPQFIVLASVGNKASGNNTNFLSSDISYTVNANIRKMYFTNELYDVHNAYNPTTSEFKAPFDGYYHFEAHITLKAYRKNMEINRLGVSIPYDEGGIPTKEGESHASNASFALLNQPKNAVLSTSTDPLTINMSGVVYIPKGKVVCILTRYITPSTSTSTNDAYSLDTETTLGINREDGNRFSITYYPSGIGNK